ncbi:MAG TPA: cation:proton antiporter [Usitatibacter sp.]|nr:cation:proton antiporter [Usitatibacter sp.]
MNFSFLPTLPFTLSYPLLFGVLLVAGMLGGEIARIVRIPRIIGYVVVGFFLAPFTEAMGMGSLLDEGRIFVDLALGLVLFDLGRRMDLKWMKRDWTIAATGFAESLLAFFAVLATLLAFRYDPVKAGLAASIAMTTSPAVLMLIVHDSRSDGQVTERAMNLTALNGLLSSILVTILLGSAHYEAQSQLEVAFLQPLYLFLGSLALGATMSWISRAIARHIEKTREVHFALIAGMVVCAVGLATMLKLPVILALLSFGLFARNDDRSYDLLNVNLAPVGRLLYIVLFVITGASLPLSSLVDGGLVGLLVALARAAGKFTGILAIAPLGGLRVRQAIGLGASVMPMSSLALLMQHDIARLFPPFGEELSVVLLASILVMELVGPFAVQWGLRFAGDVLPLEETGARPIAARVPSAPGD